jgi:hypothetical protein
MLVVALPHINGMDVRHCQVDIEYVESIPERAPDDKKSARFCNTVQALLQRFE